MSDKQIVIELTVTMLRTVPTDWDEQMINFWYSESSHCMSSEIADLHEWNEKAEKYGCCDSCGRTTAKLLREATAEDLDVLGLIPTHESVERQQAQP